MAASILYNFNHSAQKKNTVTVQNLVIIVAAAIATAAVTVANALVHVCHQQTARTDAKIIIIAANFAAAIAVALLLLLLKLQQLWRHVVTLIEWSLNDCARCLNAATLRKQREKRQIREQRGKHVVMHQCLCC